MALRAVSRVAASRGANHRKAVKVGVAWPVRVAVTTPVARQGLLEQLADLEEQRVQAKRASLQATLVGQLVPLSWAAQVAVCPSVIRPSLGTFFGSATVLRSTATLRGKPKS